jgi:hypothetical protein|tara:strand:+ start:2067 stop:2564 length:498 start_codon:yes stop_codon:yes gene_type:complete
MKPNKFKDVNGRWLTQSLFPETATDDRFILYTLRDESPKGVPSLKHLYLELMDFTEYRFASKYLGGWEHWNRLCNNALIGREIAKWREELEIKLVATGLTQITDIALDVENKGRLAAARFLAEKGFKPKQAAGRPTKQQALGERVQSDAIADRVSSDLERLKSLQ